MKKTSLALALLLAPVLAFGYQGGTLVNHSHSSSAGQGGATLSGTTCTNCTLAGTTTLSGTTTLTNPTISGTLTVGTTIQAGPSAFTPGASPMEATTPVYAGAFTLVWSTSVVNVDATTMTVTNVSEANYFFVWKSTNTSATTSIPMINFNTDAGTNYLGWGNCDNTVTGGTPSGTALSGIQMGEFTTNFITTKAMWRAQGYIYPGDGTSVPMVNYQIGFNNATKGGCTGGGMWNNVAAITQIVFKATQKWTGKIYVYKGINQGGF